MSSPVYVQDFERLRDKLLRAERDGTLMGRVWASVRRRAQAAPKSFPWFVPFVAAVTRRPQDLDAARQVIRDYVGTFDSQSFGMGLQFHFWCFSFPHARWSLYFQWLDSLGAWDPAEAAELREKLIEWQFVNFFYGLRTKPEPECVDNQTMSLCFSCALIGHLFGDGPDGSAMAARMLVDGRRRLPAMLGGMPPSGYSGEGSTYMDHVVGPCVPFVVELLERIEGGDWFRRALEPRGGSAEAIVRMIAREWMPNGLVLPWDHYGYQLPVRSCIAYGAHRTGEPLYLELLEKHACWGAEASIGWGFDDLVWTLVWWPEERAEAAGPVFPSWCEPEVGAALVSDASDLYLMQMWDESTPGYPTRAHVNPNALVLSAFGSPLTTDGVRAKDCTVFNFDDTWKEISNANFTPIRTNFGPGCGGAHGVLLVDGWEGMRAERSYTQAEMLRFDAESRIVSADVTPIYRERWADARAVRRTSRLCCDRFWLIEDEAEFGAEHEFTARWFLRPSLVQDARGVTIETAEGVRLTVLPLVGPDQKTVREVAGYPDRLDGRSLMVDFRQKGRTCRWCWLAWPEATRSEAADVSEGWQAVADAASEMDIESARRALAASSLRLSLTLPAFMLAEVPVARRWWYRRTIELPAGGRRWLRLPRQMIEARLWVGGRPIDLAPYETLMELMEPHVEMPPDLAGAVEVVLRTDCGVSQYDERDGGGTGLSGRPALLVPAPGRPVETAEYCNGVVTIRAQGREWCVDLRTREIPR